MWTRTILAAALLQAGCTQESQPRRTDLKPTDWLLAAENDEARDRLIQNQFRGFDQAMWEVGDRYRQMHGALERGNPQLATYHWEKIRAAIENGIAKRQARASNAKSLFLDAVWEDVHAGLQSGDPRRAWTAFERAKTACQACHHAEEVPYMNDQPVFDLSAPQGSAQ